MKDYFVKSFARVNGAALNAVVYNFVNGIFPFTIYEFLNKFIYWSEKHLGDKKLLIANIYLVGLLVKGVNSLILPEFLRFFVEFLELLWQISGFR